MAAVIVREALRRNGARRPTWDQGQPEYASDGFAPIERTRCVHCRRPIPPDRGSRNGASVLYCSNECVSAAHTAKARRSGERMARAEYLASQAVRSATTAEERASVCQHCSKLFHTAKLGQRYCSLECVAAARTQYERQHNCEQCGKAFTPKMNGKQGAAVKYCSHACASLARTKPPVERQCEFCGEAFLPKRERSDRPIKFCSKACSTRSWQARKAETAAVDNMEVRAYIQSHELPNP